MRLAGAPSSYPQMVSCSRTYDSSASYPPAWKEMRAVNSPFGRRGSSLMLTHCFATKAGRSTGERP